MVAAVKVAVSSLYAGAFLVLSFQGRFFSLFLQDLGLSTPQIGVVMAVGSCVGLAATPGWSAVCDHLQQHRQVLLISISLSAVAVLGYWVQYLCDSEWPRSFGWLIFVRSVFSLFGKPLVTLLDAISMQALPNKAEWGHCRLWGAVSWAISHLLILGPLLDRVGPWVMVPGYVLSSLVLILVEESMLPRRTSGQEEPNNADDADDSTLEYAPVGAATELSNCEDVTAAPTVAVELTKEKLELTPRSEERVNLKENSAAFVSSQDASSPRQLRALDNTAIEAGAATTVSFKAIVAILWVDGASSIAFFVLLFLLGIATSLVEGLVFLFFRNELGASYTLCGVSVLITVLFEIPIFSYSDRLITNVPVPVLLLVASVSYCVRVVAYTLFEEPWFVLLVEPLHGVTFACSQLAAVHYTASIAPKGLETSAQGLRSSLGSLGGIVGTLCGGLAMDEIGSVTMYRCSAAMLAIGTCLYLAMTKPCASKLRAQIAQDVTQNVGDGDLETSKDEGDELYNPSLRLNYLGFFSTLSFQQFYATAGAVQVINM